MKIIDTLKMFGFPLFRLALVVVLSTVFYKALVAWHLFTAAFWLALALTVLSAGGGLVGDIKSIKDSKF